MFEHTRPAELDADGGTDAWAPFRVGPPQERLRLLRELRDGGGPVILNAPDGATLSTTLWSVDAPLERLSFSIEPGAPMLQRVLDADEAVAVAYLENVKLQFDVHGLMVVRGPHSCALHGSMPGAIYRFQRRNAYRVRTVERHAPTAHFRHPAMPEMTLALRVLDVSIGGCALWLPHDVPPLQAGSVIGEMQVELDADTRFATPATLQHVSTLGGNSADGGRGERVGCEWQRLPGTAERSLQRWIDRTQQRRRLLSLG